MNRGTRKRSTVGLIFDFVLTICTGGVVACLDCDSVSEKQQLNIGRNRFAIK